MSTFTFTAATNNFTGTTLADTFILVDPTFYDPSVDKANGGGGTDTLKIGDIIQNLGGSVILDNILTTTTNFSNIEVITLLGTGAINVDATRLTKALTFNGNVADNIIIGTSANDKITGGTGSDTLTGGSGNDQFFLANTADYGATESIDGGVGTADILRYTGTVGASLTLNASFINVENVTIGTTSGSIVGLAAINIDASAVLNGVTLTGNNGANTLTGTAFNDFLIGNDGVDILSGGAGNDGFGLASIAHFDAGSTMSGGADIDTLFWTGGAITLNNTNLITDTILNSIEKVTLGSITGSTSGTSIINVDASSITHAMTLTGNNGINKLTGTAFDDTITGGGGNDNLIGGLGNDTYVYTATSNFALGETVNDAGGTADTLNLNATSGTLTLTNKVDGIEFININSTGSVNLHASALETAVTITGGTGANILTGTAFVDTLDGGSGNDTFIISNALHHGAGETINGNTGTLDTIRFTSGTASTLTLDANTTGIEKIVIGTGTGTTVDATGTAALNVDASALVTGYTTTGVTMTGNAGANALTGTAFDDIITGAGGVDNLVGGGGNDRFDISSYSASEIINGGTGTADTLRFTGGVTLVTTTLTLNGTNVTGIETIEIATGTVPLGVITGTFAVNVNASALTSGVTINGNAGINVFTGTSFDDTLNGNNGKDTLNGGLGNDTFVLKLLGDFDTGEAMDGGAGTDTLNYTTSVAGTLTLTAAVDNIELINITHATAAIGINAALINTNGVTITGNDGINALTGTGFGDILIGGLGNDTLTGGAGVDDLSGDAGNDTLNGDAGNDILNGGAGNDIMNGGADTDTADYSDATGNVTVNLTTTTIQVTGGAGNDTLNTIENLTGGTGNDTFTGNTGNNVLSGGDGNDTLNGGDGNDTLNGGNNNDTLNGGLGNDTMDGGDHDDTYIVDSTGDVAAELFNDVPGGVDTVQSSVTHTLSTALENLTLTGSLAINGTGNANDNVITGNSGINILTGAAGNDTLSGGAGNDTLAGADDDTLLDGGADTDTLNVGANFNDASDGQIVNIENVVLTAAVTLDLGNQTETFTITGSSSADSITGGSGNDTISGGADSDTIDGGAGNDTLTGGAGTDILNGGGDDDIYLIGAGDHTAAEITDSFGTNEVRFTSTTGATLTIFAGDTGFQAVKISNAAGVTTGTTAENIDASLSVNQLTITGNDGDNSLTGTVNADTITGGGGNDTITGADNDTLLDGGSGTADILSVGASFFLDASNGQIVNIEQVTLTVAATLNLGDQTENLTINGSTGADTITGGSGNDTISGGSGADDIDGGAGNDSISGADDDTSLNGGADNDTLFVTSFTDTGNSQIINIENVVLTAAGTLNLSNQSENYTITGSTGADSITGGSGADSISGGAGNDTISGAGTDTLLDGGADNDTLNVGANFFDASDGQIVNIEQVTLTATATLNLSLQTESFTITGSSGADTITSGSGIDSITGGSGADSLNGGAGNDIIFGDDTDTLLDGDFGFFDTLSVGANFTDTNDAQIANIENVVLTAAATLSLGNQTESFTITGSTGSDVILSGSGNDAISGGDGFDELFGGNGNDILNGGDNSPDDLHGQDGNDTLTGGINSSGGDWFFFETTLGATNVDTITDFSSADSDSIRLDLSIFSALSTANGNTLDAGDFETGNGLVAALTNTDACIVYDSTSGNLYYDSDGNATTGTGNETLFATLTGAPSLAATDISVFSIA